MTSPLLAFKRAAGKTSVIAAEIEACRFVDAISGGACDDACRECLDTLYGRADPAEHREAVADIIRRGGLDHPPEARERAVAYFLASLEAETLDTPEVLPGKGGKGKPRV